MNTQQSFFSKRLKPYWFALILSISPAALAQQAQPQPVPLPPKLSGSAWVLMDAKSGNLLVSENADERLPPASLTKLMTAYIATLEIDSGRIGEHDSVRVSEKAWRTEGSRMFIKVGTEVSVSDLLHGIIIQSGNDASVALAEHIAGSEETFADLMNRAAEKLSMANSRFQNATGLPHPEHYSSAHDMARLARAIIHENADHYALYAQKEFTWNDIKQSNRNLLLWQDPSVDGLKTGHTKEAGYCLVASAVRDNTRLIAVLFGSKSEKARAAEIQKLLTYGFRFFETVSLYPANSEIAKSKVWKGASSQVKAGTLREFLVSIPKGQASIIKKQAKIQLDENLVAPIAKGQKIGSLQLSLEGEPLQNIDLVALEAVEQGGLFSRLWDSIVLFFRGLFN